jgi:hypothetical protein
MHKSRELSRWAGEIHEFMEAGSWDVSCIHEFMEPGSWDVRWMHQFMDTGSWDIISVHRARKSEYQMHEFMDLWVGGGIPPWARDYIYGYGYGYG